MKTTGTIMPAVESGLIDGLVIRYKNGRSVICYETKLGKTEVSVYKAALATANRA